jgi:transposase
MAGLPAAPCDLPRQLPETGRRLAEQLIDVLHTCPNPEIARLGRTLRQWRTQILARFATGGVNNSCTEAISGIIEKARRLAHGFRNFDNNRLRILLAADDGGEDPACRLP